MSKITLETAGTVWKLLVKDGDQVKEGDTLFIMEVMKMEVPYEAPHDGTVKNVEIAEGDVLEEDDEAMEIA